MEGEDGVAYLWDEDEPTGIKCLEVLERRRKSSVEMGTEFSRKHALEEGSKKENQDEGRRRGRN